ncbi:MAG TPA: type I methionyl aminopeptidase [Candidatus Agrococcus pullicola]|uniref:Methionine aminopeptidase n=1 Tax=Candidatus Agrococcus pullicola TaxID=2838429 RepID=A0A9D1YWD3_9MICO|nr:type I methionyl aminopeptidase [Candidatus Agrococcus pullicola]
MPKNSSGHLIPGTVHTDPLPPSAIARPEYVGKKGPAKHTGGNVYTADEVARIRESGRIAADSLDAVASIIRPGTTTQEINALVYDFLVARGAYPSTLTYRGYPKSSCTSVNEVICHGIPDETVLEEGDIVNVDVTAYVDGMHGDLNRTFPVGTISDEVSALIDRTREALRRGIKAAMPGRRVNIIGRAIEAYAARFGYGVVQDFTGHGVGRSFHSGLIIPHFDSDRFTDMIEPGMVFTIEPMLTLGTHEWDMWDDGWTATTKDKSLTAQFEHTIHITERGAEILTLSSSEIDSGR